MVASRSGKRGEGRERRRRERARKERDKQEEGGKRERRRERARKERGRQEEGEKREQRRKGPGRNEEKGQEETRRAGGGREEGGARNKQQARYIRIPFVLFLLFVRRSAAWEQVVSPRSVPTEYVPPAHPMPPASTQGATIGNVEFTVGPLAHASSTSRMRSWNYAIEMPRASCASRWHLLHHRGAPRLQISNIVCLRIARP